MFFNRNRVDDHSQRIGLSDGVETKVAEFVKDWGALQRGQRSSVADRQEEPMKLFTDADVAYFVKAMEDEAALLETEIKDARKRHLADIAQKDAQIAAINREIETRKAKLQDQDAEIHRRALALVDAKNTAKKIFPNFEGDGFTSALDVRREVVRRRCGDAAVEGKTEAYIDERFEILVARVNVDPFAVVASEGFRTNDAKAECDRAYEDMVQRLRDSHKEPTKH